MRKVPAPSITLADVDGSSETYFPFFKPNEHVHYAFPGYQRQRVRHQPLGSCEQPLDGYEELVWYPRPGLLDDAPSVLRYRLQRRPENRTAKAAAELGWLFGPTNEPGQVAERDWSALSTLDVAGPR